MGQNLKRQVKSVKSNGQTMTLQEKNSEIGVKENYTSKYFESIKCIIRGESGNPNDEERRAVMTGTHVIDKQTCKKLFILFYVKIYPSFNTFS